ncbi:MAG: MBL fold metallo-hydrolase [Verrucomicrobiota bacterium]
MLFQNLARHEDIGSNSYLLQFGDTRFVIDAGIHPKHTGRDTLPLFENLGGDPVDNIFLTHSHLDHVGSLPFLMKRNPEASVIMTEETAVAARALLHNSVNVMTKQRSELDEQTYPLFNHKWVDQCARMWLQQPVGRHMRLGTMDRVDCQFFHAGHVLGAVGIQFQYEGRTTFFTGDFHAEDQTITTQFDYPTEGIDDLIIECTRGANPRDADYSREKEKQAFGQAIAETLDGGGAVLIPVFAFGKTQEVVMMLEELVEEGVIPRVPVHIGGLSSKMTMIADKFSESPLRRHRGFNILEDVPMLEVLERGRSAPDFAPGNIYALSSGMMTEHTVSNKFAKHVLSHEKHSIVFVGYCDPDAPGGKIQAAEKGDMICLEENGSREFPLNCRVEKFDFSGHATREQIMDYVVTCAPSQVILTHGDMDAKHWFQREISAALPNTVVRLPAPGEIIE